MWWHFGALVSQSFLTQCYPYLSSNPHPYALHTHHAKQRYNEWDENPTHYHPPYTTLPYPQRR